MFMGFFGPGRINNIEPKIVTLDKPIKATGLSVRTDMKNIYRDVSQVLKKYMSYK